MTRPFLTLDGCSEHERCMVMYGHSGDIGVVVHLRHDTALTLAAALMQQVPEGPDGDG